MVSVVSSARHISVGPAVKLVQTIQEKKNDLTFYLNPNAEQLK